MSRLTRRQNESKCWFSCLDIFCFVLLILAAAFAATSLFTQRWLDESFETKGDATVFAYYRQHGLWRYCSKKIFLGKLLTKNPLTASGASSGSERQRSDEGFECMSRFQRGCPQIGGCPLFDDYIKYLHDQVKEWELACLCLMSISTAISLIVVLIFLFICRRCPILVALMTLAAAGCSCAVVVLFVSYHSSSESTRKQVVSILLNETDSYGYSFYLAVAASCVQFLSGLSVLVFSIYTYCKRCFRGYH